MPRRGAEVSDRVDDGWGKTAALPREKSEFSIPKPVSVPATDAGAGIRRLTWGRKAHPAQ